MFERNADQELFGETTRRFLEKDVPFRDVPRSAPSR
jgi:hypothetical protein